MIELIQNLEDSGLDRGHIEQIVSDLVDLAIKGDTRAISEMVEELEGRGRESRSSPDFDLEIFETFHPDVLEFFEVDVLEAQEWAMKFAEGLMQQGRSQDEIDGIMGEMIAMAQAGDIDGLQMMVAEMEGNSEEHGDPMGEEAEDDWMDNCPWKECKEERENWEREGNGMSWQDWVDQYVDKDEEAHDDDGSDKDMPAPADNCPRKGPGETWTQWISRLEEEDGFRYADLIFFQFIYYSGEQWTMVDKLFEEKAEQYMESPDPVLSFYEDNYPTNLEDDINHWMET